MKFALWWWLLVLIPLVPGAIFFYRWASRKRLAMLDRVIAPRLREQLLQSVDYVRRRRKYFLLTLALCLLLLALARPIGGEREVRIELPGIDYFIALDVSRSMLAEDAGQTNRLHAAKQALGKLLDLPAGDRVGLITFAGEAFLVSPLSQDHGAIKRSLMAQTTASVSKPGTDLAAAITLALKSFEAKQVGGKAILLVSDGEELQGDAIIAAREAAAQKAAVFTVGVGSAVGARVPQRSGGEINFAKNEFGREVISRMNERVLQQVATAGRGIYAALGEDGKGVLAVYEQGMRRLPKGTHVRKSKDMYEFFQVPLAIALALLLGEMLVSDRKRT